MTSDVPPFPSRIEEWNAETAANSLHAVYENTVESAEARARWYMKKSRRPRFCSIALRFGAVAIGSIGGLAPLLVATGAFTGTLDPDSLPIGDAEFREAIVDAINASRFNLETWGYVALAVAGLLVAGDKALGFSTTWMRFMETHLGIQKALTIFRYDWAVELAKLGGQAPGRESYVALIGVQKQLVETVESLTEMETKTWIVEFNRSLSQLARTYEKKAEQLQPGALDISVSNADKAKGDIELKVDARSLGNITAAGRQVPGALPGTHTIEVIGMLDDQEAADSTSVTVEPGGVKRVELTLKSKKTG